ncbi:DeoR family transcriptional regulator [Bacteroides sp.]|uniref:DeoR family transcriptional regulator n=1 Tax=Bacteroides sp. TaxID=29523 RepID=UPI00260A0C07|nr:DeoR family transcriptional regulator [Bacteroides sp.]MDD3041223.1 DeoR family transcriptional regulator [Bacteroides sp.]
MNNQKDTQRTTTNSYGQLDVSDVKALSGIAVYGLTNKKTEKLVTALYLVSDCMDTDDALKSKIRLLGVELLSDIYQYSVLSPVEKSSFVATPISRVYELLSFIEIAKTIGFISEMNASILNHEFSKLAVDLRESVSKDRHFSFTLDDKMFEVGDDTFEDLQNGNQSLSRTSENMSVRNFTHNHLTNNVSYKDQRFDKKETAKKTLSHLQGPAAREDRIKRIMSLIKDKKDVSIKDISIFLPDYSEKTIQRELNGLVDKGQIKKTGTKRWSRYKLA